MDSGQDSGQDTGTPLVDAAAMLGTTPAALRKRLQRGSVPGYKRAGQWYVLMDGVHPTGSPRAGHGQATALARTDDQRAADLATVLDRVAQLYEAQLAAKDQTIAANEDVIAELRREVEELRRQTAPQPASATTTQTTPPDTPDAPAPAGGFWQRVRRVFGGE